MGAEGSGTLIENVVELGAPSHCHEGFEMSLWSESREATLQSEVTETKKQDHLQVSFSGKRDDAFTCSHEYLVNLRICGPQA